jgi:hypothetical protein
MRKSLLLTMAMLTPLIGCENPFTHKNDPAVRNSSSDSPRDAGPTITIVPVDAKYALMCFDKRNDIPLALVRLRRGEEVGFRQENGLLVAVAGKQTFAVSDGTLGWVVVDKKPDFSRWNDVKEQTAESLENIKQFLAPVAGVAVVVCVVAGVIVGAAASHGNLTGLELGSPGS